MGSRGSEFDNSVKKINDMIDDLVSTPTGANIIQQYLKAIDDRDKDAVLKLDKKLKNSKHLKEYEKVIAARKELLNLAKDAPKEVTKIHELTKQKISKKAKEEWEKLPLNEKVSYYLNKYKGKKFRLKNDVSVGGDWSKIGLYEPAGTEVGTLLKVKASTSGGTYEWNGKEVDSGVPLMEHFSFLMDQGNGYTKWYSLNDLELID